MEKELEGKVSLVTGASRGLGRAIAIKLATLGSKVAINYLSNDEAAQEVFREVEKRGSEAMLTKAHVGDTKAVKTMISQIANKWGKIDILVNNAGIVRDTLLMRMTDESWDDVINSHLRGAYLCTKFALRHMTDQSWGRIISISSLAGIWGNAGQSNYSAAKAGIIAFTKSIAREVGSLGITVNAVAPGFIVTEMTDKLPPETREMILARIPVKRFGRPEDVAELVAFLATERASYITAQVISIDGGIL